MKASCCGEVRLWLWGHGWDGCATLLMRRQGRDALAAGERAGRLRYGTEGACARLRRCAHRHCSVPRSAVASHPRGEVDCADDEVVGHLRPRASRLLEQADGVELECLVVALTGGGCALVLGRRLHVVKFGVYAFRVHNIPAHSNRPRNPSNPDPEDFDNLRRGRHLKSMWTAGGPVRTDWKNFLKTIFLT